MKAALRVLFVSVLALAAPSFSNAQHYNPSADFSIANNPNGVWSYGWQSTLGSTFNLYSLAIPNNYGIADFPTWYEPLSSNGAPLIVNNETGNIITSIPNIIYQVGQMALHPGVGGQYSTLRWTAPNTGRYFLTAAFSGLDYCTSYGGTTTDVHVLHNNVSVYSGAVNGGGSTATLPVTSVDVSAGDTIDFTVGFGNGVYYCDTTGLYAAISTENAPKTRHYWRFEDDPGFLIDSVGSSDLTGNAQPVLLPPLGRGAAFPDNLSVPAGGSNAVAAEFDGISDALTTTITPIIGDFTVEAFVHLDTVAGQAVCIACVLTHPSFTATIGWGLQVRLDGTSGSQPQELVLYLSDGTAFEFVGSDFILNTGIDYYVAAAVDLAGAAVTFYLQDLTNGGTLQSVTKSHSRSALNPISALAIGDDGTGWPDFNLDGLIDEVRISEGVLPQEDLLINKRVLLNLAQNQWHLISPLPLDGGGTVGEIVGNDVLAGNLDSAIYGNATANGWIMHQHNALTNLYETLTIDSPLTVGRGYWLKTLAANQSFTVSGNANSVTPIDLEAAPNPADGRSNMLGHPYDYNVCWNDAQISNDNFATFETPTTADPGNICDTDPADPTCILSRKMYKWNGAAYQTFDGTTPGAEGVLEPFDGFFVKVFKPGYQLQIPATPSCQGVTAAAQATLARTLKTTDGSDPESTSAAKKVRNPDEWNIRLTVSAESLTDPGNLIGRLNDSRDGHDAHDLDERPADFNPHLTLVFPHHDWGDHAGDYTTDYRALERNPTGVTDWDFEIRSDQLRTITLTWDIDNQDIRNHSRLIDVENNVTIKPKKVNHYTIPMVGTTHRFAWRTQAGR